MKKIISILMSVMAAFAVSSCGIFNASPEVNEDAVNATVESGIYVSVNTIMGKMGRPINSFDGYYLSIKDGKAKSYLPFFGEVYYSAGYGTGSGIMLDDCPVTVVETTKKDTRIWRFVATQGQENIEFVLEFSDSGFANITCTSTRRSVMHYSGLVTKAPQK